LGCGGGAVEGARSVGWCCREQAKSTMGIPQTARDRCVGKRKGSLFHHTTPICPHFQNHQLLFSVTPTQHAQQYYYFLQLY